MSWLAKLTGSNRPKSSASSGAAAPRRAASERSAELPGIQVAIDRHQYGVADMSIRTFLIAPYDGDLIPKQKFAFKFILDKTGKSDPITIFCQGYVRTIDQNGMLAIFRQPQPVYQQVLINYLLETKGGRVSR